MDCAFTQGKFDVNMYDLLKSTATKRDVEVFLESQTAQEYHSHYLRPRGLPGRWI